MYRNKVGNRKRGGGVRKECIIGIVQSGRKDRKERTQE
jgi:hypothetical protein